MLTFHRYALIGCIVSMWACMGCIEAVDTDHTAPFEVADLDATLAIVVDMSSSFSDSWDTRAYDMFVDLSDRYFTAGMGDQNRIVIAQLSGAKQVVLFEGRPADLRARFKSPDELNQFLKDQSDPSRSPVFEATKRATDYVNSMPGVTDRTRSLIVVLSDMRDSQLDRTVRSTEGFAMLESLKTYQQRGGSIALYMVAESETDRWARILEMAGFQPGHYVIENNVTASPRLPSFN